MFKKKEFVKDLKKPQKSALEPPEDPLYKDMFYLNPAFPNRAVSQREDRDGRPQIRHMNISGAWEQGYSGKGITRSEIVDVFSQPFFNKNINI